MSNNALSKSVSRFRISRLRWQEYFFGYLFILPWLLGFFLWTAGPMIASLVLTFMKWDILTAPSWVGLENWQTLFKDPLVGTSLINTAYYTLIGGPLLLAVSLSAALAMNLQIRGIRVYRTIYYLPTITPVVASVLLWMWIFNPDFGLLNYGLNLLGLPGKRWLFDTTWVKPALILMSLWGFGNQMVIFLAGLQGIPYEMHEAAQIDGAGRWQRFWNITIPMLTPVIFFNLIIGLIASFQVFTVAFIATGGGPANATLFAVLYLYRMAFEYFRMGYGAALAWLIFLITLLMTLLQFVTAGRWVYYEGQLKD